MANFADKSSPLKVGARLPVVGSGAGCLPHHEDVVRSSLTTPSLPFLDAPRQRPSSSAGADSFLIAIGAPWVLRLSTINRANEPACPVALRIALISPPLQYKTIHNLA